ncbi:hypothetical protein [Pilimelia columellifera]|uniref:Holin n=1 Tax=Pilimelia columellifera subsp. columellifera TaxID=706583 RepID=A0ABN3N632_9ACTN
MTLLDSALRVVGGVVAVLLALLTGVLELVLVPLRIGGVPLGLGVVLAVVVNYWLPRFTVVATGVRWTMALPFIAWLGLMMVAAGRRDEGDLLVVSGGIAVLTNLAGSLAFGVAMYRAILPSSTRARPSGGEL